VTVPFVLASSNPGLYGLVGAVAGALLTGAYGQFRDWRRAKKQFKAAVRVLGSEIADARDICNETLETNTWPIGMTPQWTRSWNDYRTSIVNWLSPEEYDIVARGYVQLDQLEHSLRTPRSPDAEIKDQDRIFLRRVTGASTADSHPADGAPAKPSSAVDDDHPNASDIGRALTVLMKHRG